MGWAAVESHSSPGEIVYENEFTGERISWQPHSYAGRFPGTSPDLAQAHTTSHRLPTALITY